MRIEQNLVATSKYSLKCPYSMNPEYITVHNTYNDAPAENEIKYMVGNNSSTGFHVAVDDKRAIQGIPFNRNAWACGDGNGSGNRKSLSVEICYSKSGGDRYYKAEDNAAVVVSQLMKQYNIPLSNVRTHQSWNGKYCPHRILDNGSWGAFLDKVKKAYNGGVSSPSAPTLVPPSSKGIGIAYITGHNVNLRSGPGTNYGSIRKMNPPESYIVWAEQDGWLNLGGDQWVKNDPSFVRFERDGSSSGRSYVGKRVVSKVNGLNFYDRPTWNKTYVVGQCNAGEGFTIDEKVSVDDAYQYKVHNSKGATFYITASPTYVDVR